MKLFRTLFVLASLGVLLAAIVGVHYFTNFSDASYAVRVYACFAVGFATLIMFVVAALLGDERYER